MLQGVDMGKNLDDVFDLVKGSADQLGKVLAEVDRAYIRDREKEEGMTALPPPPGQWGSHHGNR